MTNPTMEIADYIANGPFDIDEISKGPGVYIILCDNPDQSKYGIIDIGESEDVKSRLQTHDRKDCWEQNCPHTLKVAVIRNNVANEDNRRVIEKKLREQFNPPCGQN